jgi:DNA-binding NtrC family response regulator
MQRIDKTILIVEDEAVIAEDLRMVLEDNGYAVCGVENSVNRAIEAVNRHAPFLVLVDIFLKGARSGIQLAQVLNERNIPFVYVSANCDREILEAAKATSPYGFIVKPFREKDLLVTLDIALYHFEHNRQLKVPRHGGVYRSGSLRQTEAAGFEGIIGQSEPMLQVFRMAEQVAKMDTSVLILGESGTGKEGIATAIHQLSPRAGKPLVKINCAALPANLIESELFGHEKGAFTGAHDRKIGKFERAHGGTIFLDEIGEMSLDLQVKLLRVLQEREIERVGGNGPIAVDVRVITATNRGLEQMIADGKFRLDLYYRLNVFPIPMPALRDRPGDIRLLANHFAGFFANSAGRSGVSISESAMVQLCQYPWPGNIRELQNIIERHVLLLHGDVLDRVVLPSAPVHKDSGDDQPARTISEVERNHIVEVLKKCKNKMSGPGGAAEFLDIPASTLYSRMKKLGISKKEYVKE